MFHNVIWREGLTFGETIWISAKLIFPTSDVSLGFGIFWSRFTWLAGMHQISLYWSLSTSKIPDHQWNPRLETIPICILSRNFPRDNSNWNYSCDGCTKPAGLSLRRSWALACLMNSRCCRHIDSLEVFQALISSVRQDMFMFSLSKGSAVNCPAVLLLLFFLSFVVLLCHTSLNVEKLRVGGHNFCVACPSASRSTTSSERSQSSWSCTSTDSRSLIPFRVIKKSYTMLHVSS